MKQGKFRDKIKPKDKLNLKINSIIKLISKINGWTWNAVSKPTNIVVSGKGITSIPGKSDVELFELEYNAYLGDTNAFSVDVQATTSTPLSKCLIINTAGSTLTLDKICFQNGRFIRGSGIGYALKQIGQSPAVDQASIEYSIGISGQTTIELYNSMGQKVHTLLNGTLQSGSYELSLSTESLPSGMYICCLLYTSPSPRDRQKSRMPSSA